MGRKACREKSGKPSINGWHGRREGGGREGNNDEFEKGDGKRPRCGGVLSASRKKKGLGDRLNEVGAKGEIKGSCVTAYREKNSLERKT